MPNAMPTVSDTPNATTTETTDTMTIHISLTDADQPEGKLADAELHFTAGPLKGLKLVGFTVWRRRNGGQNVTFPARQYSADGQWRSFALLRDISGQDGSRALRDRIVEAYGAAVAAASTP